MKEKIESFFKSRYGTDQLSLFLIIISIILTILSMIFKLQILLSLSYVPLLVALFRTFSSDKNKRSMENYKFHIFISPLYKRISIYKQIFKDRKDYKYFKCTNCNTYVRIPKGKGKIKVKCTKCGTKFEGRS